ncbi:MAG: hypothetical protein DSY79_12515 [Chloroflexi bacterium]|nr:MAG: hypothetical protein COA56_13560 [Dehalococcoidia bacterium]RUA19874.1 MAG: hypothetical protein DSY79_12515 [Chloroflexota bacterium]RUA31105.1 MAG: hypothetical protein DSY78_07215 [Chloroflexota bacterium]
MGNGGQKHVPPDSWAVHLIHAPGNRVGGAHLRNGAGHRGVAVNALGLQLGGLVLEVGFQLLDDVVLLGWI